MTAKTLAVSLAAGAVVAGVAHAAPADERIAVQALARPTADGGLGFRQKRLAAHPGRITLVFTNPARLEHNVALRFGGRRIAITPTVSGGRTARVTVRLRPGVYTFYCAVPGHEASGMKGRLTVFRDS